jgi:uncharacterized protein with HEPN domain
MRATPSDRLAHALQAIADLESLVDEHDLGAIRKSAVLRAALERFLEIISEAVRHLPDEWKQTDDNIPWRGIAAIGNVIRHGYDGIDVSRLWMLANDDLPVLKAALLNMGERYR